MCVRQLEKSAHCNRYFCKRERSVVCYECVSIAQKTPLVGRDSHPYCSRLLVMCFPFSTSTPSLNPYRLLTRVGPLLYSLTRYDRRVAPIPATAASKSRSAWCERISKSLMECMICKRKSSQLLARLCRRWLVFHLSTTLSVRYFWRRGYPCSGDRTGKMPEIACDDKFSV